MFDQDIEAHSHVLVVSTRPTAIWSPTWTRTGSASTVHPGPLAEAICEAAASASANDRASGEPCMQRRARRGDSSE